MNVNAKKPMSHGEMNKYPIRLSWRHPFFRFRVRAFFSGMAFSSIVCNAHLFVLT
jgi:hypothetical protein